MTGGELEISGSSFYENRARCGGAFFAQDTNQSWIRRTQFVRNNASADGGALCARNSIMTLTEGTLLDGNVAAGAGQTAFMDAASVIAYALPGPEGYWINNPVTDQGLTSWRLSQPYDDPTLPYPCAPGLRGSGTDVASQSTPLCSGPCPAGFYCERANLVPIIW